MRLLLLMPMLPSPPRSGGAARIHGLVSSLARRHEIAILAYTRPGEDVGGALGVTGEYAAEIVTVQNPQFGVNSRRRRVGQLRSLVSRASYERRVYQLPEFQSALDRLAADWEPDAIVVEFAQLGYFRFPDGVPLVLDAHNVEHELLLRMVAGGALARRVYSRRNAAKLRREEAALLGTVDAVAATSERDRALLLQLAPGVSVTVIPNGVSTAEFRPLPDAPKGAEVLFFGAMDYYPNADAVLRFHRAIWPRLRAERPDLRFAIVGREPPDPVRALDGRDGIEVIGQVDDLRPWIAGAQVVVVPLRYGSGTRLKVLEALAMGMPVVSTSLGVEGLDVVDGEHLLVADRPADFAGAVSKLLDSPEERQRLGTAGRRLIEERYDWQRIADGFERLLVSVVEGRSRQPR